MPLCPTCCGRKTVSAVLHLATAPFSKKELQDLRISECATCEGTGTIDEAHMGRIERGRIIRSQRLTQNKSLGQYAHDHDIHILELNALENGREWKGEE